MPLIDSIKGFCSYKLFETGNTIRLNKARFFVHTQWTHMTTFCHNVFIIGLPYSSFVISILYCPELSIFLSHLLSCCPDCIDWNSNVTTKSSFWYFYTYGHPIPNLSKFDNNLRWMSHQSRKPQIRKHHFRTHHSRNGQNSERLIPGRNNFRNEISMGRIIFGKSWTWYTEYSLPVVHMFSKLTK